MKLKILGVVFAILVVVCAVGGMRYLSLHRPPPEAANILRLAQQNVRQRLPFDALVRFAPFEEISIQEVGANTWEVGGVVAVIEPGGSRKSYAFKCRVAPNDGNELNAETMFIDRLY